MSSEQVREASPPPLLAYTASHQQSMKGKGKPTKKNKSKKSISIPIHKRKRAAEPVLFDEKSRREFLTGFHKRKQARIETGKKKAIEREKEERRKFRAETRKARKEQAAENVRMEKIAYGGEEESDDEDVEAEGEGARELSPSAYETEEHHTTVTVQEWNPEEEEESLQAKAHEKTISKIKKHQEALPPSSRRVAKKLKNATSQQTQKSARSKNLADARAISKLLETEDAPIAPISEDPLTLANAEKTKDEEDKKKKSPKFYYESKLERAKAKAKIRETRQKFAEKRKLQRLEANKNGGKRMRKSKGRK